MKVHLIVGSSVLLLLGLLSAALCFVAVAKTAKAGNTDTCPVKIPPWVYQVAAVGALTLANLITKILTRNNCCEQRHYQSDCGWTTSVICYSFSWVFFLIAFFMLVIGAIVDGTGYANSGNCSTVPRGVLAAAGGLSLASVILGIVYYVILESEDN